MRRGGSSRYTSRDEVTQQATDPDFLKKTIELLIANFQYTLEYYQKLNNPQFSFNAMVQDIRKNLEILLKETQSNVLNEKLQQTLNTIVDFRKEIDKLALEIYCQNNDLRWLPGYFNPKPFQALLGGQIDVGFTKNQAREEIIPSECGISTVIGRFLAPALKLELLSLVALPQFAEQCSIQRPFIQLTEAGLFIFSKELGLPSFAKNLEGYLQYILENKGLVNFRIRLFPTKDELDSIQNSKKIEIQSYFSEKKLFEETIENRTILVPHWAIPYILELAKFYPQDIEPGMEDFYRAQGLQEKLPELIANSYKILNIPYSSPTTNLSLSLYCTPNKSDQTLTIHFTLPSINGTGYSSLPPILFLVDDSGSMDSNNRIPTAKAALTTFYNQIPGSTEIALNSFDNEGRVVLKRTRKEFINYSAWEQHLRQITGKGGTSFVAAFKSLSSHIQAGEDLSDMVVVLLTDGGTQEQLSDFIKAMQATFGGKKVPHIYPIGLRPTDRADITTVQSIAGDPIIGGIGFQLIQYEVSPNQMAEIVNQTIEAIGKERQSVALRIQSDNYIQVISLGTLVAGATKSFNVCMPNVEGSGEIVIEVLTGFTSYQRYKLKTNNQVPRPTSDILDDYFRPQYLACFSNTEKEIREQNITWDPNKNISIIESLAKNLALLIKNYGVLQSVLAEQINIDLHNFQSSNLNHKNDYLRQRFQALRITSTFSSSSIQTASVVYRGGRGGSSANYIHSSHTDASSSTTVTATIPVLPKDPILVMLEGNKNNLELLFNQLQGHLEKYREEVVSWQKDGSYIQVNLPKKVQEAFSIIPDLQNKEILQQMIKWFSEERQAERLIYLFLTMINEEKILLKDFFVIRERLCRANNVGVAILSLLDLRRCADIVTVHPRSACYLNLEIKHFSSPYLYVDPEQNVHILVPIANVGNTNIALDNTCKGLLAYKDWQTNCLASLEKARQYYHSLELNQITRQIERYLGVLRDFLQGDLLTQSGQVKSETIGFNLPPSIVEILKHDNANYVNLWLTPIGPWDNCCPIPDSVQSLFRMRDYICGFPYELVSELQKLATPIVRLPSNVFLSETMIKAIIDEYIEYNLGPIQTQENFENLLLLIQKRIPQFKVDPSINLISWCKSSVSGLDLPETIAEQEILALHIKNIQEETSPNGVYVYIREDIETMIRYLAENRTDLSVLPSPLSGEIDIERLSIRVQLWLGMLSVFIYQHTEQRFDLGQFISDTPEIRHILIDCILKFISNPISKTTLEDQLVWCLKKEKDHLPKHIIFALDNINFEEAKKIFREAVFTIDKSQHYDNFQVYFDSFFLGVSKIRLLGSCYKFSGKVSLSLETFFQQFNPNDIFADKQQEFFGLLEKLQKQSLVEFQSNQNTLERSSFRQRIDVANLEASALAEILMSKTESSYIFESLDEDTCKSIYNREDFANIYTEIAGQNPRILTAFRKKFKLEEEFNDHSYYFFSSEQVLAMEFREGGQYYFLNAFSSTVDRIHQFFNCVPGIKVVKNNQSGCYTLCVPVTEAEALSEKLSILRTSLHLTPSIAATLYNRVEDLGKGDYIQHKNNQQEDYRQTKIYAALQALGLAVETISCLEYSDMNGYILRLKKHSPLVSQVLEVYQQVISRYQIVGQVFKGNELLKLCHYLGFCTQLNITKETFLERLHQKCFSYPETVQNGSSFFSIAEIVGRGGNFSIELMDSSLLLWSKDANQMDKLVHEGLLLCIPQWFMEIVRRDLGEQQVAPKFARSALALH